MVPKSYEAVRDKLDNFWGHGLSIPTGGSAWGEKEKKESLYPEVVKRLKKTFFRPEPRRSVVQLNSRLYVEGLLQGPVAEEPLIELKQGFCELADPPVEGAKSTSRMFCRLLSRWQTTAKTAKGSSSSRWPIRNRLRLV